MADQTAAPAHVPYVLPPDLQMIDACNRNDVAKVTLLISEGLEPTAELGNQKKTALEIACIAGRFEVIQSLLQYYPDLNTLPFNPLMWACIHGNIEMAKLLVAHGADVNVTNTNTTILSWALTSKKPSLIVYLLSVGARLDESKDRMSKIIAPNCHLDDLIRIVNFSQLRKTCEKDQRGEIPHTCEGSAISSRLLSLQTLNLSRSVIQYNLPPIAPPSFAQATTTAK